MSLIATSKHPYESEGATLTATGFDAQMLLDRGYAISSDEPVAKVATKPIQKPKTKKEMKKLILLLIAVIGFAFVQAQTVTMLPVLSPTVTYQEVLTDYTLTNSVGRTFKWTLNQHYPTTQDFTVHMDSLTGSLTNVLVTVWGQKSALKNDSTSIGTLNWKGTLASGAPDTTGIISNTTENRYRTIYSTFKGTGTGTVKIDVQAIKLYWPD